VASDKPAADVPIESVAERSPEAVTEPPPAAREAAADPTTGGRAQPTEAETAAELAAAQEAASREALSRDEPAPIDGEAKAAARDDDTAAVKPMVPAPPPPPPRFPVRAVAVATLLGGVVGGAVAFGLSTLVAPADHLPDRVANLERALEGLRSSALKRADFDGLEKRVAALAARPPEPAPAPPPSPPADGRLEAIENTLKGLDPQALRVAVDAGRRTAALEERVSSLEKAASSARGDVAARAVVASALVRAVDAGAPYAGELQALSGLGVDAARLAPLKDAASRGLPTPAMLARDFAPLSSKILAEVTPSDGSVLNRLAASAAQVVRVRPVGEAPGADPPATVARIEAALARGALADALKEWKALPEPGRRVSEAWGKALEARVMADAAARGILADAVAALGSAPRSN
jgi:hypothetical protein